MSQNIEHVHTKTKCVKRMFVCLFELAQICLHYCPKFIPSRTTIQTNVNPSICVCVCVAPLAFINIYTCIYWHNHITDKFVPPYPDKQTY